MKIFLTGGTGFVGSHVLAVLAQMPHEVTALRRSGSLRPTGWKGHLIKFRWETSQALTRSCIWHRSG